MKPVLQLPDVGKNLSEYAGVFNSWFVNSNDTLDDIGRDPELGAKYLRQWQLNKTGPFVMNGGSHIIFSRLPDNSSIFRGTPDPSSGKNTPHYELFAANGAIIPGMEGHFISLVAVAVTTTSRGNITLNTSNPFDNPLIDLGLLTTEFDMFTLHEAVKASIRFLAAPVWKDYAIGPTGGLQNATTDAELD